MRAVSSQREKNAPPRKPEGGYQPIPTAALALAWWRYRHEKAIRLADLRVWFAAWEMAARRRGRPDPLPRRFGLDELRALTGSTPGELKESLQRLQAAGLLTWSESILEFPTSTSAVPLLDRAGFERFVQRLPGPGRRVPVPRRILRMLADDARPAVIATALGCLIRCLRFKDGVLLDRGRVKASWIAEAFGLSLRRIKQARRDLTAVGWLVPLESPQWELNRWGAQVRINLAWSRPTAGAPESDAPLHGGAPHRVEAGRPKSSPPPADSGAKSSPPDLNSKPFQEEENQKPASGGRTGFFQPRTGAGKPETSRRTSKPTLRDVKPEDLADVGRLLALHDQAVDRGLAAASEFGRLQFLAAAEHARAIGEKNPCGLFVHLVRGGLWHFATQDDETTANARLKRHLHQPPPTPRPRPDPEPIGRPQSRPAESDDARQVRAVREAAVHCGWRNDPFLLLRRTDAAWTRERWNRAAAELGGRSLQNRGSSSR